MQAAAERGTILVAEDDPGVRRMVRDVLVTHGYRVLEAGDGEEALRLCEQHADEIQLLLTDVVMPGLSGRDLAARAASRWPRMKRVAMSGYVSDGLTLDGALGGIPFLHKPFDPETLSSLIRRTLR